MCALCIPKQGEVHYYVPSATREGDHGHKDSIGVLVRIPILLGSASKGFEFSWRIVRYIGHFFWGSWTLLVHQKTSVYDRSGFWHGCILPPIPIAYPLSPPLGLVKNLESRTPWNAVGISRLFPRLSLSYCSTLITHKGTFVDISRNRAASPNDSATRQVRALSGRVSSECLTHPGRLFCDHLLIWRSLFATLWCFGLVHSVPDSEDLAEYPSVRNPAPSCGQSISFGICLYYGFQSYIYHEHEDEDESHPLSSRDDWWYDQSVRLIR